MSGDLHVKLVDSFGRSSVEMLIRTVEESGIRPSLDSVSISCSVCAGIAAI